MEAKKVIVVALNHLNKRIYTFALDHMKVDHTGVNGVPALRALFTLARRRDVLLRQQEAIRKQLEELDAEILALR